MALIFGEAFGAPAQFGKMSLQHQVLHFSPLFHILLPYGLALLGRAYLFSSLPKSTPFPVSSLIPKPSVSCHSFIIRLTLFPVKQSTVLIFVTCLVPGVEVGWGVGALDGTRILTGLYSVTMLSPLGLDELSSFYYEVLVPLLASKSVSWLVF